MDLNIRGFFSDLFTKSKPEIYFIGLPKTGSTSLANSIRKNDSQHEFWHDKFSDNYYKYVNNLIDEIEFQKFIELRLSSSKSRFDIATFNYLYYDYLYINKPNTKFIKPIRELSSWMNSFINHIRADLHLYGYQSWKNKLGKALFGSWFDLNFFIDESQIITNLPIIIPQLCSMWNEAIVSCLKYRNNRVLLYNTNYLNVDITFLLEFASLKLSDLNLDNLHSNKAHFKTNFLSYDNVLYNNSVYENCKGSLLILSDLGISDMNNFTYKII